MTDALRYRLDPEPGAQLSPAPWASQDDGTIVAADGHCVCVLGSPFDGIQEQDITNGAAILAVPELISALRACLSRIERPHLSPDGNVVAERARAALAKAGLK